MKMNRKVLEYCCQHLPEPIAVAFSKALIAIEPTEQFKLLTDTLEVFTRYLSAIAFAEYCSLPANKRTDEQVMFSESSVGNGNAISRCTHIFKHLKKQDHCFADEVIRWYLSGQQPSESVQAVVDLITLRNNFIHRQVPMETVNDFRHRLLRIFSGAPWLYDYQMFVVLRQDPTEPSGNIGYIRWLMGTGKPSDIQRLHWSVRLYTEDIYLVHPERDGFLRLYPFLDWNDDETRYEKGVFLWEKVKRRSIHYLAARSPAIRSELVAYQNLLLPWQEFLARRPTECCLLLDQAELNFYPEEEDSEEISEEEEEQGRDWFAWQLGFVVIVCFFAGMMMQSQQEPSPEVEQPLYQIELHFIPSLPNDAQVFLNGQALDATELQSLGLHRPADQYTFEIYIADDKCTVENNLMAVEQNIAFEVRWNCLRRMQYSMVEIGAGEFTMGAPRSVRERDEDEQQHSVVFEYSFEIGATEVTQQLWTEVMGKNPSYFQGCAQCPVEQISWYEAVEFANVLSRREFLQACYEIRGKDVTFIGLECEGYRLPTEAEWEFAARNGKRFLYAGSQNPVAVANFQSFSSPMETIPVASLKDNGNGLFDMSGNVYEWCQDWYGAYANIPALNPVGPIHGVKKVGRGGGFSSQEQDIRVTNRSSAPPETKLNFIGVRLSRTTDGQKNR